MVRSCQYGRGEIKYQGREKCRSWFSVSYYFPFLTWYTMTCPIFCIFIDSRPYIIVFFFQINLQVSFIPRCDTECKVSNSFRNTPPPFGFTNPLQASSDTNRHHRQPTKTMRSTPDLTPHRFPYQKQLPNSILTILFPFYKTLYILFTLDQYTLLKF